MDILQFINQYWQVLAFVGIVIASWVTFRNDLSDMKIEMAGQKEEHDKQLGDLNTKYRSVESRVSNLKDDTFKVISLMQLDIREIMTILKGDQTRK